MQIGLEGVAETQFCYAARRANLPYSMSLLNPHTRTSACPQVLTRSSVSTQVINTTDLEGRPSNGLLQTHLSNLEKLIQKKAPAPSILPETTEGTGRDTCRATKQTLSLEGFNLGRFLWDSKAAAAVEEMSPSNLNRLKLLLSTKSVEYSPRNSLCTRWREYHGCNDWVGLLDPLDENLRREVVRYGEFVQAAYHAFHSHPSVTETISSSVSSSDTVPFHVVLPDKSYQVTSNLYATSSLAMPQWVDDVAPSLGWMTQRSSWIGYVAVCDDKREIARMGRRDIVIALRGTSTCLEWGENLRDFLVDLPIPTREPYSKHNPIPNKGKAKVECGFLSLYKTPGSNSPSLSESIMKEINRLINLYKGEPLSISVTGHSLGAALALLAGDELSSISSTYNIPTAVFSFGGPRVGNRGFANRITENGVKVLRVVNSQDLITQVPGMLCNETLDQKLRETGLLDEVPWTYAHVGTELRVDTKMSPYLKPNADVACCHDLEAYLHLVDGFLASNCPFRPNAKRSLGTLLSQQGSNVKKLYTKVHAQKTNLHNHQDGSIMSDLRV